MQKQWTRPCNIPLKPFFNGIKPAHQRKETVEIAEIIKHSRTLVRNKDNNQRNTNITSSEIRFTGFSPEVLVFDEFLG